MARVKDVALALGTFLRRIITFINILVEQCGGRLALNARNMIALHDWDGARLPQCALLGLHRIFAFNAYILCACGNSRWRRSSPLEILDVTYGVLRCCGAEYRCAWRTLLPQ